MYAAHKGTLILYSTAVATKWRSRAFVTAANLCALVDGSRSVGRSVRSSVGRWVGQSVGQSLQSSQKGPLLFGGV